MLELCRYHFIKNEYIIYLVPRSLGIYLSNVEIDVLNDALKALLM